ncbi:MAG: hypothetical protein JXR88_12925 [Clostridia bacterium]|nr:hypothetical protein [Clostridia bacterium]
MKKFISTLLIVVLVFSSVLPVFATESDEIIKEETVYGILDADGHVKNVIVTEHIQKHEESIVLNHTMDDVELLMDHVDFTINQDTYTFASKENDLYYRGTTTKALPIETTISYVLDGEEIQSSELLNKTGHLVMTIHQTNHVKRSIVIDNETKDVYLPFETALVLPMDNHHFENVTASTGKIMDDGKMKVLTAVLTPGLKETLDLDVEYLNDEVIIEADVTDFKMGNIYMTTICKLPDIDLSEYVADFGDIDSKINAFQSAGVQLDNGGKALKQGVMTYFGKQTEAFNGFDAFLVNNEKVLNGIIGYKQGLQAFNEGLKLYTTGVLQLAEGLSQLQSQFPELVKGFTALQSSLTLILPDNQQGQALSAGLNSLLENLNGVNVALDALNVGGQQLKAQTENLNAGSAQLLQGGEQLAAGAKQLLDKQPVIKGATTQLSTAGNDLINGVADLSQGISSFNEDGINKMVTELNEAIIRVDAFKALYDALKSEVDNYDQFVGDNQGINESVLFILKTDSIQ